jgi:signal transduction histidine kinase
MLVHVPQAPTLDDLARARPLVGALLLALVGMAAGATALPDAGDAAVVIGMANGAVALVGSWAARRRALAEPSARRGWRLLAFALFMYSLGQVGAVAPLVGVGQRAVFPTTADVLAMAFTPVAGLAMLLWGDRSHGSIRLRTGLDGLLAGAACFFVMWSLSLGSRDLASVSRPMLAVALGFLLGTSFNLGVSMQLAQRSLDRWRGPLGFLHVGFVIAGGTGVLMLLIGMDHHYYSGHPVDVFAIAGAAVASFGFLSPRPVLPAPRHDDGSWLAELLPYLPIAIVVGVVAVRLAHGRPPDLVETGVSIGLMVVMGARQLVALRDVRRLTSTLEAKVIERTRQLEESQQALTRAQRLEALGQMSGGVAHDFNNLLTVIATSARTVRRSAPPEVAGDLDTVDAAVERAASLTRQLLAFARKQAVEPRVFDVNRLLRDAEPLLHRLVGREVRVVFALGEIHQRVSADPGQIEQVVVNLVANARDAMPEGGEIRVSSAHADARAAGVTLAGGRSAVCITVSDHGVGMSPEVVARAFEPFFTTKEPGRGTGLGLATCWGIARQSGGHLAIRSQPGQGTSVTLWLPGTDEAEALAPPPVRLPSAQRAAVQARILVADDTPGVRTAIARALRDLGYEVLEAGDGDEALRVSGQLDRLDLLVTDMAMPRMSGRELARRVREQHAEVKVLTVSGYHDELPDVPGEGVLHKPFSPEALGARVQALLAG